MLNSPFIISAVILRSMRCPPELEEIIFGDKVIIELIGISRDTLMEDIFSIFHSHYADGCILGHFVEEHTDEIVYDIDLAINDKKTASFRMIDLGEKIILQKNEISGRHPAFSVN
jgi:hypothetical protein